MLIPIIIIAARSGGHILPAITLAQQYEPDRSIVAVTADCAGDRALIRQSPAVVRHETLPFTAAPVKWYAYPVSLIYFVWSLIRCIYLFWQINPPLVITTGGAIALPGVLAARMMGIPCVLYELNAVPGRATRHAARWATQVYCVFPQTCRMIRGGVACVLAPYPVRYTSRMSREAARKKLGIEGDGPVVLVLGGSQGSHELNAHAAHAIGQALPDAIVLHQAGPEHARYQHWYTQAKIAARVVAFEHDLSAWYAAADCAIARGGSGTLHELAFFQVPTCVIPLVAQSTDHQVDNAHAMQQQYPDLFVVARDDDPATTSELLYRWLRMRAHNAVPNRERAL